MQHSVIQSPPLRGLDENAGDVDAGVIGTSPLHLWAWYGALVLVAVAGVALVVLSIWLKQPVASS